MATVITKASGQTEAFVIRKLVDSLIRSGATEETAWSIARKIQDEMPPVSSTKHIFRTARRLLRHYNRASDMRYSIKKSLYSLGPSGYQFEKYFARILKAYGYSAEVNRIMNGYCVTHEVDVLAARDGQGCVIECKYHSNSGNPTDVKVALYIYSRLQDIMRAPAPVSGKNVTIQEGWLVTNTRCTSDARKFAECVGLKIVSWKYPEKNSLEKMIENRRLYPVTILSSIKKNALEILFRNDIILAKDIADMDEHQFLRKSGLDAGIARILKKEADELCSHS
jgi:hypothetical protein